jgi:hypothetical protein
MTADLYLAGELVPAGVYRDVDTGREIRLETAGFLPASLDGRVAAYVCVLYTWDETGNWILKPDTISVMSREERRVAN